MGINCNKLKMEVKQAIIDMAENSSMHADAVREVHKY